MSFSVRLFCQDIPILLTYHVHASRYPLQCMMGALHDAGQVIGVLFLRAI
jgi:hypothetical protein